MQRPTASTHVTTPPPHLDPISLSNPAPQPAPFQPQPVEVALGQHGGKLTLMTKEGGGFTLDGEDAAAGALVTSEENGLHYKLALGEDGAWAAAYQAASASVTLGASGGTLALSQNEDKTWSAGGGEPLPENLTVPGDNGLQGSLYRVLQADDGSLLADRYDLDIEGSPFTVNLKGDAARPASKVDDRATAADETGTALLVGGAEFGIGQLLGGGSHESEGEAIVEIARKEVAKLRD